MIDKLSHGQHIDVKSKYIHTKYDETRCNSTRRSATSPTLGYGYGLEPVQLPQQAGALGRVQAVDELLGSLRRVERLHGLLQRVSAQAAPLLLLLLQRGGQAVAEAASGQPGAGPQGEGGPQDCAQAGQHLRDEGGET